MDYTKLDELIKTKKKSDASKDKKHEYAAEMQKLFIEEGYSVKAEKYLYEGLSFLGAEPLAIYIKNQPSNKRAEILSFIIKGNYYKANEKGIAFKLLTSLFCQTLNMFPEEISFIETIIKDMPDKSKNKEKQLWVDTVKTIEKYFLSPLNKKNDLPILSQLNLRPIFISQFCSFFSKVVCELKPTKDISINDIQKVAAWADNSSSANTSNLIQGEESRFGNDTQKGENVYEIKKNPIAQELLELSKLLELSTNQLNFTSDCIKSLKKDLNDSEKESTILKDEVGSLKKTNDCLRQSIEKQNQSYEKIEAEKYSVISENIALKKDLSEQKNTIESIKNENSRLNSIISVYSFDKQNSQKEQLNSIASKLKTEYLDFKSVEFEEISLSLGENFRQQLITVFKILAKSGIDIERR